MSCCYVRASAAASCLKRWRLEILFLKNASTNVFVCDYVIALEIQFLMNVSPNLMVFACMIALGIIFFINVSANVLILLI